MGAVTEALAEGVTARVRTTLLDLILGERAVFPSLIELLTEQPMVLGKDGCFFEGQLSVLKGGFDGGTDLFPLGLLLLDSSGNGVQDGLGVLGADVALGDEVVEHLFEEAEPSVCGSVPLIDFLGNGCPG